MGYVISNNKIGGVTISRKGKSNLISDGEIGKLHMWPIQQILQMQDIFETQVQSVGIYGSPRRCGGQVNILSGSVAVFLSWARQHISATERKPTISPTKPTVLGCIAGSALLRKAASLALGHKKWATLTTHIIECLGRSLVAIFPAST